MARGRSRVVGQSLHHAPPRSIRSRYAAYHASHASKGRDTAGAMSIGLRLRPPTIVLSVLCAMYFLLFINRTNIAIAGPLMQADLKLSNTDLGLAFSAFAYPYAAFQLFGGVLGDKFGPRLTLAVSAFVVFLATAWIGAVGGMASLFMARILLGIGEGAAFPTATRAMSGWTPIGQWAFAQGITHTFSRVGNWATALIVSGLIALLSWRASFYLPAPVQLIWIGLWVS